MTDQRIFPFFVNGIYWRKLAVDEQAIRQGFVLRHVTTQLTACSRLPGPETMAAMKKICFQLAECGEQQHGMVAHWVQAFWICDEELEIEDGHLYLKSKEEAVR